MVAAGACVLGVEATWLAGLGSGACVAIGADAGFAALKRITRDWFRERYGRIDPDSYGVDLSEDDFEYTWSNFEGLPEFFENAARANRAVIFTADQ